MKKKLDILFQNVNINKVLFDIAMLFVFLSYWFVWYKTSYVLLVFFAFDIYIIFFRRKLEFDFRKIIVIFMFLLVRWFGFEHDVSLVVHSLLPAVLMLFVDSVVYEGSDDERLYKLKRIMYTYAYAGVYILILSATSYFYNYTNEYIYPGRRTWPSFYLMYDVPATVYSFFGLTIISLMFYGFFIFIIKKNVQGILLALFSLGSILFLYGVAKIRSILLIAALEFFVFLFFVGITLYKKGKFKLKNILLCVFFLLLVIFAVSVHFISLDDFQKIWSRDGGIVNNVRFVAQKKAITQMFDYPFGGRKMDIAGLSAVHNFWLDIAYEAGIIPFIISILYLSIVFYDVLIFIKNRFISLDIKLLLFFPWLAFTLWFGIEAVVSGSAMIYSYWFILNTLIWGANKYIGKQ